MGGATSDWIVGRDREVAEIERVLHLATRGPAALVLEGDPGIGKTTLWRAGIERARGLGFRVLVARPAEAERELSFTGLADLVADVADRLDALPPPQRRSLRVALLLDDAGAAQIDDRAVALAVLGLLRSLAAEQPLLVAVDDTQWLDPPSQAAVEYALRRLDREPVGVLAAHRTGEPSRLVLEEPERVRVGPLTLAATHELLRRRLGRTFPRPTLVRLHETSNGNPFFAIELARALGDRQLAADEPIPVTETLRELVVKRFAGLSPHARETTLFVAALGRPNASTLSAAIGDAKRVAADLDQAVAAEVLDRDRDRLRFSHPLLASVRYADATPAERRAVHRRLAEVVADPEERARHAGAAAESPDGDVAAALEAAALAARARGAPAAAGELAEAAARLTPPCDEADARRRRVAAADHHFVAGSTAHAHELLEQALATAPRGPERARVAARLASQLDQHHLERARTLLVNALREAEGDPRLQAEIQIGMASSFGNESQEEAGRHARVAVELAERAGDPALLAAALTLAAGCDFAGGAGIDEATMRRALVLEQSAPDLPLEQRPSTSYAWMLKWSGELDRSRPIYERLRRLAPDEGDATVCMVLVNLAFQELLADAWEQAAGYADEAYALACQSRRAVDEGLSLLARAVVAAHVGDPAVARAAVAEAAPLAVDSGVESVHTVLAGWAIGLIELSLDRPAEALASLRPATASQVANGFGEPGLRWSIDVHIDAAVEAGELDEARGLLDWIESRAQALDRPWALALAARGRALLAAADGDGAGSDAAFAAAYDQHARRPQQFAGFGLARTLLAHGTVLRRRRSKRLASERLGQALVIFDQLGARLWAEKTRSELARIGGRPLAAGDELTETERQIADLVCEGRTNKEVAAALSLSPKTVEWNLSKVYAKLGVRSRGELAAARRPH